MALGCTASEGNRSPQSPTSASTPASTAAQTGSDSASLAPGRYCYGIESEDLSGVIRLAVEESQSVTGDSSATIHADSEGYYSSYAQKLEGILQAGQISMDVTTWIEYDLQESQEVWTVTPETLKTEQRTFTAIDCATAQERFVGPDGLEASDLLEGVTLRPQQVQFEPGTSSAVLEGAVVQGERNVYRVDAQGGQQMFLDITSLEDNAVFDVISPSGFVLERESTSGDVLLPQTGEYQVVVGGTRGNAAYTLKIDIP
ncbi:MAG: hypothetical protein ICV77_03885 [Cyanobacteria bacterium Co-bin8]|nr:hypothetical protein [Cyanobacteria bacterium Co-bin8]